MIRQTRGAARNEKLKEWRRAHLEERMRIVIPSRYILPIEHHVRDPYVCEVGIIICSYAPLMLTDWCRITRLQ